MNNIYIKFAKILKSSRLKSNLTQQHVANILNISIGQYKKMEKYADPDWIILVKIKKIFPKISLDKLFNNK